MAIAYLSRSENRIAVLFSLQEAGPLDRNDLEEAVSASRRTVSRVLGELTEEGFIRESAAGFRLTRFGAVVTDAYRQCAEQIDLARRFQPFLANVDDSNVDFDPECLRDADLTVATDTDPYAANSRMLEIRQDASWVRSAASLITKKSIEQIIDRLHSDESVEYEFVFPASLCDRLQSQPFYSEPFGQMTAASAVTVWIHPDPVPLLHAVTDSVTAVGTSIEGRPYALVESTNPGLREWVTDRLDQFTRQAVPIEEFDG